MLSRKTRLAQWMLIVFAVTGLTARTVAADGAVEMRLGIACQPGSPYLDMVDALARQVENATGGEVALNVAVFSHADAPRDMYAQLTDGRLDLTCFEPWMLGTQRPGLSALGAPFIFTNAFQARGFYGGAGGERIGELLAAERMSILGWIECSPPVLLSERPLEQPEDLSGLRIGFPGVLPADRRRALATAFGKLDAEAGSLGEAEQIRAALQQGAVDALRATPAELLKMADVLPENMRQATFVADYLPFFAVCASESALAKLSEEQKAAFLGGILTGVMNASDVVERANAEAKSALTKAGFVFEAADVKAMAAAVRQSSDPIVAATDRRVLDLVAENQKPVLFR